MKYAVLSVLLLCGCVKEPPPQTCARQGQMVTTKLDGRKGMVIWANAYSFQVRFRSIDVRTNTSLVGSDGPVEFGPYATVWMQCFEIEQSVE